MSCNLQFVDAVQGHITVDAYQGFFNPIVLILSALIK